MILKQLDAQCTDQSLILCSHSIMSFTCGGPPEPHSFKALKDIRIKGSCEASVQRDIDPVSRTTLSVLFPSGFSNICCSFKLWHIYQFTGLFKYMCTDAFKPLGVSIVVAFRWDISSWCFDSERDEQFIPIKLNIGVNVYVRCAIQMNISEIADVDFSLCC